MKAARQTTCIGEICEVVSGGTPKTGVAEYWDGPHQWLTPAEMGKRSTPYIGQTGRSITDEGMQNSSARLLPRYSVILSSRAPIGHLAINTVPMATNQGCKGLVPRDGLEYKFLYYYLTSIVPVLNDLGTGATFKELSGGKLKEVAIPLPPVLEQQRIVAILDEAFDGIATTRANAEQNLRNARALFESHLQAVFSDAWSEGNLVTLADLASDITDGDHMPPPKASTGVPFITIGNIEKNTRTIDFSDTFMVPRQYFDGLKAHKKPIKGDVLYTVTGSFGIPVLVPENREFCFQRHIGLVRPRSEVSSEWLYYLLMSPQVFRQANAGATGAAQKTVSLKLLRGFQVPRISFELQQNAVEVLNATLQETQRLESIYQRKLAALDELKKSLLAQAFSGQL